MPQSTAPASTYGLQQLPVELIVQLLERLQPTELRAAAAVSRRLYKAAVVAGYSIPLQITVSGYTDGSRLEGFDSQLERFTKDAALHAQLTSVGLELDVSCNLPFPRFDESTFEWMRPFVVTVFAAVTPALPHLVALAVNLPDTFISEINAALRYAAPRLIALELDRDIPSGDIVEPLPVNLFDGLAPRLRWVTLRNVPLSLDAGPIPAFENVYNLFIEFFDDLPLGIVAPHFPRLAYLRIAYSGGGPTMMPAVDLEPSLAGLALTVLVVEDFGDFELLKPISRAFDVRKIPYFEHGCATETWTLPTWQNEIGKLSARLRFLRSCDVEPEVLVVPADRSWRYAARQKYWDLSDALPLVDLPHVGTRLEYLRMAASFLLAFLHIDRPHTVYGALKRICVDVCVDSQSDSDSEGYADSDHSDNDVPFARIWPPYSDRVLASHYAVLPDEEPLNPDRDWSSSCPRLEELKICAVSERATVRAAEAVFLARALRPAAHPTSPKLALVLAGVDLDDSVSQAVLDQTFSSAVAHAFSNTAEHDAGLWELLLHRTVTFRTQWKTVLGGDRVLADWRLVGTIDTYCGGSACTLKIIV